MNKSTTDTPRTDACPHCGKEHNPWRSCPLAELRADYVEMTERAEKAEAKANKLESTLRRIIDAPVFDPAKLIEFSMKLLWDSIAEAKVTLNPTDK